MRKSLERLSLLALLLNHAWLLQASAEDEAILFTPPGFTRPGEPRTTAGVGTGTIRIIVIDEAMGKPTPCRLNVVGADGNFYQPEPNRLTPYSLTGRWPKTGKGNREGKAPFRYYGRFFYCPGQIEVKVPAGPVRLEAAKGFEYRASERERRGRTGRNPDPDAQAGEEEQRVRRPPLG